jgi:hypothetical protein
MSTKSAWFATLAASVFAIGSLSMGTGCGGSDTVTGSDTGVADANPDVHVSTDSGSAGDSTIDGSTSICGDSSTLTQCGTGCYDTQTDSNNCGICGNTCTPGQSCAGGSCQTTCAGSTLCGTQCVNEQTDNANCGACSNPCVAGTVCSGGSCRTTCGGGLIECSEDAGSECKDLLSDSNNCGSCSNVCATGSVCSAGACVSQCTAPLIDCRNGCIDPSTTDQNCGAAGACGADGGSAGISCATGLTCVGGVCLAVCIPGQIMCGGTCIDPSTSNAYCGATAGCTGAIACAPGTVCTGSVCKTSCNPGQIVCGGTCVDPGTNLTFCGATSDCTAASAGIHCPSGDVCTDGVCQVTCNPSFVDCNGTCIDPGSNTTYCGASADCATPNEGITCLAGYVCSSGICALRCQAGLVNCNGVCVNPLTDPDYCGANSTCANCLVGQCSCMAGDVCTGGGEGGAASTCQVSCLGTEVECNGRCIDPITDSFFCGATPGGKCDRPSVPDAGNPDYEGVNCSTVAGATCAGGTCTCPAGDVTCGATCINPVTDNAYCGATPGCGSSGGDPGQNCSTVGAGATCGVLPLALTATCNCPTGEVVCNVGGTPTCINPGTDNAFCGADANCLGFTSCAGIAGANCGVVLPATTGTCNCPSGDVDCDVNGQQTCIDPTTSSTNCGASGNCLSVSAGQTCGPLTQCTTGAGGTQCTSTCQGAGLPAACFPDGGAPYCANTISDNANCGSCGTLCPSLTTCGLDGGVGACNSTCTAGQTACSGGSAPNPVTPYCASLATDTNNCGPGGADPTINGCGHVCTPPLLCSGGTCVSSCTAPDNTFCAGPPALCADTTSDNANCGACGSVCGTNNCISSVCCPVGSTGICSGSCSNPLTDPNNCAVCGHVCGPSTPFCDNGLCVVDIPYSDSFTNGSASPNQCVDWRAFTAQLTGVYSSITLSGSNDTVGVTCLGASANTLCQALHTNTTVSGLACGGRSWTVEGSCGGSEPELSANGNWCGCGAGYDVRPCIGNSNWGGIDGATCGAASQTISVICQ